jgi:accessory gene regulator protein AgrB
MVYGTLDEVSIDLHKKNKIVGIIYTILTFVGLGFLWLGLYLNNLTLLIACIVDTLFIIISLPTKLLDNIVKKYLIEDKILSQV